MPPKQEVNLFELPKTTTARTTFLFLSYRSWALFFIAFALLFLAWLLGALGKGQKKSNQKNPRSEKEDEPSLSSRTASQHKRSASTHQDDKSSHPARPSLPLQHHQQQHLQRQVTTQQQPRVLSSGYDPLKVDQRMNVYISRFIAENNDDKLISEASIPGIGPSAIEKLQSENILLVCQLIGRFS
jgi:cytoskeletal protein RodZ